MKLRFYTPPTLVCKCVVRHLCMRFAFIYTALVRAFSHTKVGGVYTTIFLLSISRAFAAVPVSPHSDSSWTGIQLLQGAMISGLFNQILKRSFGREEPHAKTRPRGAFRPFPSFSKFDGEIYKYDSLPSGHMTLASLFWTVVIENYPEYKPILLPVEILSLALLGIQMMHSSVHWASDYPLAIGTGYAVGKSVTRLGRKHEKLEENVTASSMVYPVMSENGPGIGLIYVF